jgi:carboxyl-terminal processing protease
LLRLLAAGLLLVGSAQSLPADEGQRLEEIRTLLREQALVAPDEGRLSALDGADLQQGLKAIDPWAELREPADDRPLFAGIGADLYSAAGQHWLMPYVGGSLMQAGFADRVQLLAVDGVEVAGRTTGQVARMLAGAPGERRQLDLCLPGCVAPLSMALELEVLRPRSVERLRIGGRVVVRIRHFEAWETRSFLHAIVQSSPSHEPLLLDLRDCQGGDLFEAMDTAALFLPEGAELASVRGRDEASRLYRAPGGDKIATRPTVFVSRYTASAGEIFAGILQGQGAANLVGERTRGKCVSQTERRLSDGSRLFFTNLAIALPGAVSCHEVGLSPDIAVESHLVDDLRALLATMQPDKPPLSGN